VTVDATVDTVVDLDAGVAVNADGAQVRRSMQRTVTETRRAFAWALCVRNGKSTLETRSKNRHSRDSRRRRDGVAADSRSFRNTVWSNTVPLSSSDSLHNSSTTRLDTISMSDGGAPRSNRHNCSRACSRGCTTRKAGPPDTTSMQPWWRFRIKNRCLKHLNAHRVNVDGASAHSL